MNGHTYDEMPEVVDDNLPLDDDTPAISALPVDEEKLAAPFFAIRHHVAALLGELKI